MQIGLSGIVQKRVKEAELAPAEEEDLAFCWDTHLIKYKNRNVLLVVNVSSRYTIAMTDIEPRNWNDYMVYIHNVIYLAMRAEGYSESQISKYLQMAGNTNLTKTHGKRAVGGINSITASIDFFGDAFEKEVKYQRELSEYINRDICTPPGFEEFGYPTELFHLDMERLGVAEKRKTAKVIDFRKYSRHEE
jgi:hypothetical protein